jgi:hypothetical protein
MITRTTSEFRKTGRGHSGQRQSFRTQLPHTSLSRTTGVDTSNLGCVISCAPQTDPCPTILRLANSDYGPQKQSGKKSRQRRVRDRLAGSDAGHRIHNKGLAVTRLLKCR